MISACSGPGASAFSSRSRMVRPLDDLHDDVRHGLAADEVLAGVVHGDDRVVVETGHRLGLAREARLGHRVLGEVGAEQLDRDGASETDVLGCEHLGHAAPAESAGQPVPAVPDQPAVTPELRRVRHAAARRLGVGRALSGLLLCHQSSPSFLPAVRAVLLRSPSATLQPPRKPPVREGAPGPARDGPAMKPSLLTVVQIPCAGRTPPVTLPRRFFRVRSRNGHRA